MKRLVILGLLMFLVFSIKVEAKVDWQSLGQKMQGERENANKNSACFNSDVTYTNNEIIVEYTLKSSEPECILADGWTLKIKNDGIMLRYNSYLTRDLIEKYSMENYGLKELVEMDNYWILKLVELLGLKASDGVTNVFYLYQSRYTYGVSDCAPNAGGCALNMYDLDYYDAFGLMLSGSALEFTKVTKNSVHVKFYNIRDNIEYCNRFERSLDKTNYVTLGDRGTCYFEYDDTGLEPNTTYYYRFNDEVASITTLKDENSGSGDDDKTDKPGDDGNNDGNDTSGDQNGGNSGNDNDQNKDDNYGNDNDQNKNDNSGNDNNHGGGNDKNNIDNPQTGFDSVMVFLIILGCVLTFIFSRWNYYNKKYL